MTSNRFVEYVLKEERYQDEKLVLYHINKVVYKEYTLLEIMYNLNRLRKEYKKILWYKNMTCLLFIICVPFIIYTSLNWITDSYYFYDKDINPFLWTLMLGGLNIPICFEYFREYKIRETLIRLGSEVQAYKNVIINTSWKFIVDRKIYEGTYKGTFQSQDLDKISNMWNIIDK